MLLSRLAKAQPVRVLPAEEVVHRAGRREGEEAAQGKARGSGGAEVDGKGVIKESTSVSRMGASSR